MQNKLIDKLKEIQLALEGKKEVGLEKMEAMADEARQAFDEALVSMARKREEILLEIRNRRQQMKQWRINWLRSVIPTDYKTLRYFISSPFIYGMTFSLLFLHVCLELYHQVCFRLYKIPMVNYKEYFIWDRHLLSYLNWFEKANCVYCSYANNLFRYAMEISARTERFWCPIKYARRIAGTHSQYDKFVDILDAEHFREKWKDLRDFSDMENNAVEPRDISAVNTANIDRE